MSLKPTKIYQAKVLEHLGNYLKLCNEKGADKAFQEYTNRMYYNIKQLPGLPYICLRVPTGGGKTRIASHSVSIVRKDYLRLDTCTVLWIVPTNQIKDQTLEALKNVTHQYRMVLDSEQDSIEVMDLQEAMFAGKEKFSQSTCIIVTTLASLRIDDITGRKIYDTNGYLMNHFMGLTETQKNNLEKGENGEILYSLANVFRMRRPLVIMDEAHNARTLLSFDSLARFNPSAIIEFTATPQEIYDPSKGLYASNVLHSVSAAELKAEGMIKMPIYLETNTDWQLILRNAINKRKHLEELAISNKKETGEYIRPILLIQAQAKSQEKETLTVEVVKKSLMDDFGIPEGQIKIATGDIKELTGVDLFREDCTVKYIITVQALKEGRDCSFAYILCSVNDISSATSVEQLIGRVLRLPDAKFKPSEELNSAYAYVVSSQFQKTLSALGAGLIESGFSKYEAKAFVQPITPQLNLFDILKNQTRKVTNEPVFYQKNNKLSKKIEFNQQTSEIKITEFISTEEVEELKNCFEIDEDKKAVEELYKCIISAFTATPNVEIEQTEQKVDKKDWKPIKVPYLAYKSGNLLEIFQDTHFLNTKWDVLKYDIKVDANKIIKEVGDTKLAKIEVDNQGEVEYGFIQDLHQQLSFITNYSNWKEADLICWLDRNIPHQDISQAKFIMFLHKVIKDITEEQKVEFEKLVHYKYNLREILTRALSESRKKANKESYQFMISGLELEVDDKFTFAYDPKNYPANWYYEGKYKFNKHFYDDIGELKSSGEEFDCAVYLDTLPEVKYWVRNLERQPIHSFWLQTSTDKFYPDFVALLNDGRVLVVEYKGEPWSQTSDTDEKDTLGKVWAAKSKGKCLYITALKESIADIKKIIEQK